MNPPAKVFRRSLQSKGMAIEGSLSLKLYLHILSSRIAQELSDPMRQGATLLVHRTADSRHS